MVLARFACQHACPPRHEAAAVDAHAG